MTILLLVGLGYVFSIAFRDVTTFEKGIRESAIIEGTNTMELLRKNLEQSLIYSYYQASFEIAKNGGYSTTITATWRNYNDLSGFPANFGKTLKSRTLEILNLYRKAIVGNGITTVDYTQIDITRKDNGEYLSVISKDKENKDQEIKVSKSSFYEVLNKANVFVLIPIRTLKLFETGKNNFIDRDSVGSQIQAAEQSISNQCNLIKINICETQINTGCESALTNTCSDIDNKFKNDFTSRITALNNVDDGINTGLSIGDAKSIHSLTINVGAGSQDPSCGCKSGKERVVTMEAPCPDDPKKTCQTQQTVCDEFYQKVPVTCNFAYFGAAKVGIKVDDDKNKYPVYDSTVDTVDMRNIQLNFNVVSGNDYSRRLI